MADEALRNGGRRPVPDPTVLTDAAIAKLKEQIESRLDSELRTVGERIDGRAEIDQLRATLATNQIEAVDRFVTNETYHQREISDIRFEAAEKLAKREAELNALALTAALSAQKEAAATAGSTFGDALGSLGRIVETSLGGLGSRIDDLKERADRSESRKEGATENRAATSENRAGMNSNVAMIGGVVLVVIAILGFIGTFIATRPMP